MNKTSLFAAVFTEVMLSGIISMLVKLNAAVETVNAAFPAAI